MRRILSTLLIVSVVALLPSAAFADQQSASLTASLKKEERVLASPAGVTQGEVGKMERLVAQIRSSGDTALLGRAELMLVLFKKRASATAERPAYDRKIQQEARSIRRDRWHRTRNAVVKTSFWIGLASLGLFGVSEAANSIAVSRYSRLTSASAASPYLIAGEVSQLTGVGGLLGAIAGLGTAWVLEINPFDIPTPTAATTPVHYPRAGMSRQQKSAYLQTLLKRQKRREGRARSARTVSKWFLIAGIAGAINTAVTGYLSNLAYQRLAGSGGAGSPPSSPVLKVYQAITISSAAVALTGLSGAAVGYILGPDPQQVAASIRELDGQLALLSASR